MATAKPQMPGPAPYAPQTPRRGRGRARLIILAAITMLAAMGWMWKPLAGDAVTTASYAAHTACACRHIGGRSLAECRADFIEGMGGIRLSEDPQARSVTAHFPLLAHQTATFRKGEGCVLEPWHKH